MSNTNKVAFNDENYKSLLDDISKLQQNYGNNIDVIVKQLNDLVGYNGDLNVEKVSKNIVSIVERLKCIKNDALAYYGAEDKIISAYMESIARIDQLIE